MVAAIMININPVDIFTHTLDKSKPNSIYFINSAEKFGFQTFGFANTNMVKIHP